MNPNFPSNDLEMTDFERSKRADNEGEGAVEGYDPPQEDSHQRGSQPGEGTSSPRGGADQAHVAEQPQIHAYLLRLAAQSDRMQAQLDRLLAETELRGDQVATIARHLTDPAAAQPVHERLADLLARLEASQAQLEELATTVTRLSRTQFRSNALAETKEQQIATALATLQEIATRREQAQEARISHEQQRLADLRAEARGELAVELLPVLDGLELALENGQALLEQRRERAAPAASAQAPERAEPHGLWRKLRSAFVGEPAPAAPPAVSEPGTDEMDDALAAWLRGLELVRERFLSRLAAEGIQLIPALGQPFDPRQHLAVETALRDDVRPGTIVAVLRKGYRQQDRVLRYAEVVVSRAPGEGTEGTSAIRGSANGEGVDREHDC